MSGFDSGCCTLVHPQGQANKWIRAMEAARKVVVLKPSTDPNYLRTLQV
jgi:dynein heavy chain